MIEAVAYVTMLMFADNKDAATVMSKSCGGGGSSLESGCDGENGAFPPTRDGCIHSLSMRERD